MVSKTFAAMPTESFLKDHKLRNSASLKRQRSDQRHRVVPHKLSSMRNIAAPMRLRRCKSMPSHLEKDEYTGKPLFWFARRAVPYQNLQRQQEESRSGSSDSSSADTSSERPPLPFMRIFRAPIQKIRCHHRANDDDAVVVDQPFLKTQDRTNSFGTATTAADDENYYGQDNDLPMVEYSDDEDEEDFNYFDDASEDDMLRGLSFLDEERE